MIHLQRRLRRQPGSECEDALRRLLAILRHQQRNIAADLRTIVACRPRDQHLRFRKQQRAEPVGLDLQVSKFGAQPRFVVGGADARAHQQDRGDHGKAEHGQCRGQHRHLLAVEIEECRQRLFQQLQIAGAGRSALLASTPTATPTMPSRTSDVHDSKVRRIAAITSDMVRPKPHDSATGASPRRSRINHNIPFGRKPVRLQIVNANCIAKKCAALTSAVRFSENRCAVSARSTQNRRCRDPSARAVERRPVPPASPARSPSARYARRAG